MAEVNHWKLMMITVTAGIIIKERKVLVAQRKPTSRRGLLWEFPGGKVKAEEDPRQCLQRELEEELGIEVDVGEQFEVVTHSYGDTAIMLLSYLCRLVRGTPRAIDCHRARWVTTRGLRRLPMSEADIPIRDALCAREDLL